MDQLTLKKQLQRLGWKRLASQDHFDVEFDLVGSRRFLFTKWNVLVKYIDVLDDEQIHHWSAILERISAKSKSWWWGRCFLLCVVADSVEVDPKYFTGAHDSFGLFGVYRLQGGGGNVFVVDMASRTIYGSVPSLPYDVHKFSRDLRGVFRERFGGVRSGN